MEANQLEQEFDQVRSDLKTLQEDVGRLAARMRSRGSERVASSLHSQGEHLRRQAGAMRDQGRHLTEELEQQIGTHPETSLAIAFGVGFFVARLFNGSRH